MIKVFTSEVDIANIVKINYNLKYFNTIYNSYCEGTKYQQKQKVQLSELIVACCTWEISLLRVCVMLNGASSPATCVGA